MAQQNARELVIKRGDGASPEAFTFVCGFRSSTFQMSNAQIDTTVPSCTNPGDPLIATARPGRQTIQFSGDGLFDNNEIGKQVVEDVQNQSIDVNYQVIVPGVGTWEGPWFISDFQLNGGMEDPLSFSATWVPLDASQLTFTPAA
ncbi:MAG: phage tail tube protein [Xanthobacteraceae bacterium]